MLSIHNYLLALIAQRIFESSRAILHVQVEKCENLALRKIKNRHIFYINILIYLLHIFCLQSSL